MQERCDIGDAHLLHMLALLPVCCDDNAGRRIEPYDARLFRSYQTLFKRHRHCAYRAVPAHGETAGCLDKQNGDIAVRPCRRIKDRAGHDVVAARLEHQPFSDPVVLGKKVRAPFDHGGAVQGRSAAGNQPHRVSAGVSVDAEEAMACHDGLRSIRSAWD